MTKRIILSGILAIILILAGVLPAAAADTEIARQLEVVPAALMEFSPGDEGLIQISIQNNNFADEIPTVATQFGLSSYYGSAVSLSVLLEKQKAPITLKTDKALIGSLAAGAVTPAIPFSIEVNGDATPGTYMVKFTLKYRSVEDTSIDDGEIITEWADRTDEQELILTIKNEPSAAEQQLDFSISRADIDKFAPGDSSAFQVCIQNNETIGQIDATALQTNLSQNYGSAVSLVAHIENVNAPLTVKTDEILLGTLPAGQATSPLPVAIEVDENAAPGTYQMKVTVNYKTLKSVSLKEGDTQLEWSSGSSSQNIDIEIKDKILKFEVTKIESNLNPGIRDQILVTFKNNGAERAEAATAKLSAISPLSLTDNTAFLGDLEPGQSATGTFGIKVTGDALPKEYTLDALVQYNNAKDENLISDTLKVPVMVSKSVSPVSIVRNQWMSALTGAGVIAVIWVIFGMVRVYRRKKS